MIREEARTQLIDLREHCADMRRYATRGESTWDADVKALDYAIEDLKQEPTTKNDLEVLDKIRAEIEALIEWHDCPTEYDNGNDAWYCEACNQAIKIIDKYKAESEGQYADSN